MATGTLKWFDSEKGYGFIATDDGDHEIFVDQPSMGPNGSQSLRAGIRVEFDALEESKGRLRAGNVVVARA
jgi:CspA family cold shock protein